MAENKDYDTGWDARQGFAAQLVYRGHLVLDSNYTSSKIWFERLQDFFDWSSCVLHKDIEKYEKAIDEINKLLYGKRLNNLKLSQKQINKNKDIAYDKMRKLFRNIHHDLWINNIYIPRYKKKNPKEAILNMGV